MLLLYEDQRVNAIYGSDHSLLLESYKAHIHNLWAECKKKNIIVACSSDYKRVLD
jgi:hypothetical protein